MSVPSHDDPDSVEETWDHLTGQWGGSRGWLADQGIIFEASITSDWSSNFHGGNNTNGTSFRHLFNANLAVDIGRLIGIDGGTLFLNFMNHNGENGSDDTGDFQGYANIDADGRTEIAELWYEHVLLDGGLRVKFGKVEANAEFAYTDNGGEFINSSMGVSPTIFTLPTYPDPAMSVIVFVHPTDNLYLGLGVFDGALQEGVNTGSRGPKTFFDSHPADMFVIGEFGVTWGLADDTLPGRFAGGGWGHTGSFDTFSGGVESGTAGFYFLVDQAIWRENPGDPGDPGDGDDGQGIGMFFQFGWADQEVSEAQLHIGSGMVLIGMIPSRDDDATGFGVTWVRFSDEAGAGFANKTETIFELFYKAQITPWLVVKPDLQYILNPGTPGAPGGEGLKDALVGTLRVELVF